MAKREATDGRRCKVCGGSIHRNNASGFCGRERRCSRARGKACYAANPEKYRARGKAYRAANPEKHRARANAYYAANPERYRTGDTLRKRLRGVRPWAYYLLDRRLAPLRRALALRKEQDAKV